MRKLMWTAGILATLWCGYWAAGTYAIRQGAAQAIAEAARNGNAIAPDIATAGFPTTFDITLSRLDLGNPQTGIRWQTPSVRLQAALVRPWHLIALLDDSHVIALPTEDIKLNAADARASLTVTPDTSLTLSQLALTLTQPALQSSRGWTGSADLAEVHVNLLPEPAHTYSVVADLTNVTLDPVFITATGLDGTIARVDLDATISFSAPLDRMAAQTRPQLTEIALSGFALDWGTVTATASGTVRADANGLAEGRVDATISNWRALVSALIGAGTLNANEGRMITGFLTGLAAQGGDPETLNLPLVFQNGTGMLGPIPLGPAPRLIAP